MSDTYTRFGLNDAFIAVSVADAHWPWIAGCFLLLVVLVAWWGSR